MALARPYFETTDVALVIAGDDDFRSGYKYWEENFDDGAFWRSQVGYGKLKERLRNVLKKLGMHTRHIDYRLRVKSAMAKRTSASVHPSFWPSLFSGLVPSLTNPGLFEANPLGHPSQHMGSIMTALIFETQGYTGAIARLITKRMTPGVFASCKVEPVESFFTSALLLQELVSRHKRTLAKGARGHWAPLVPRVKRRAEDRAKRIPKG